MSHAVAAANRPSCSLTGLPSGPPPILEGPPIDVVGPPILNSVGVSPGHSGPPILIVNSSGGGPPVGGPPLGPPAGLPPMGPPVLGPPMGLSAFPPGACMFICMDVRVCV
jgi:hypothetical protein